MGKSNRREFGDNGPGNNKQIVSKQSNIMITQNNSQGSETLNKAGIDDGKQKSKPQQRELWISGCGMLPNA